MATKLSEVITQVNKNEIQSIGTSLTRVNSIHASRDADAGRCSKRRPWSLRSLFCACLAPNPLEGEGWSDEWATRQLNSSSLPQNVLKSVADQRMSKGLLLPEKRTSHKVTLVVDLDETLVHSSFQPVPSADFVVPIQVEGKVHRVFVSKRPGVDDFVRKMGEMFELVVFTASLPQYGHPVLDRLDPHGVVQHRLFRDSCLLLNGSLVKDLAILGREVERTIIVDNSPMSYLLHPQNAVPITSWFDDPRDGELALLQPWFASLANSDDVIQPLRDLRSRLMLSRSPCKL